MNNLEILNQSVYEINKRADEIYDVSFDPEYLSIKDLPDIEYTDTKPVGETKTIIAKEYRSRQYRDDGCATYKMIRIAEQCIPQKVELLFWRVFPKIEYEVDFKTGIKWHWGYFRIGFLEDNCKTTS